MADPLDIPGYLCIPAKQRKRAWLDYHPYTLDNAEREHWRQREEERRAEKARKTRERINALRVSKGLKPHYSK